MVHKRRYTNWSELLGNTEEVKGKVTEVNSGWFIKSSVSKALIEDTKGEF